MGCAQYFQKLYPKINITSYPANVDESSFAVDYQKAKRYCEKAVETSQVELTDTDCLTKRKRKTKAVKRFSPYEHPGPRLTLVQHTTTTDSESESDDSSTPKYRTPTSNGKELDLTGY